MEKRLVFSIYLNLLITIAEVIGGLISGSLALLGDSLHNFSDTMSLLASFIAMKVGEKSKNEKYTFGYKRTEIIVAFLNAISVVVISILIFVESAKRIVQGNVVNTTVLLYVSTVGLAANLLSVLLLHTHSKESLNVRSAYLHLIADTLSSVLVVLGAVLMKTWRIYWLDPILALGIAIYMSKEAYEILKETVEILMEASPNLDFKKIKEEIEKIEGVKNAHHFHAWRVGEKELHFECHVEVNNMELKDAQRIIDDIENLMKKYNVTHVTVQLECGRCDGKMICD
ncbi:cation diffusion facilitator family transporter [Thermotoga sp. KOL6]|uniref:cation diffusion facilitator family transporter n=1 Tax=Thermotoga sp. KOL6 TaxID=126741 RepID=UPI000C77D0A1|nr:cation diffusion facilitator family transporter [Thermotoga sp. KOL6]PLV59257.1 cobalt transporter [Thermotoga sp. KOL6]